MEMDGRYKDCLRLRVQVAGYIERFLKKQEIYVETEFSEHPAKFYYRPEDGKTRSLTIVGYWDQGFYVWVVWKGEGGEREDVHVRIGNEASRRTDFPELDHLLAEL
jgi:hypothetical protein